MTILLLILLAAILATPTACIVMLAHFAASKDKFNDDENSY